jgi:hydrogenase expression/formation protein HypE
MDHMNLPGAPNVDRRLGSGKLPPDLLMSLLDELPPLPPEVRLGARVGEDACAIDIDGGTLVVATDPITLTTEDAARLSVLVNANDIAVSGARPRWFLAVVLVPPGSAEELVRDLFEGLQAALAEIGAALVGGHTEVTSAVNRPVVIGQMIGIVEKGAIVTTAGFAPGDVVLQVRPAPIEGAAVLAREASDRLGGVDIVVQEEARAALERPGISLVEPALLAVALGAKALHDPTEGGLAGGLHEMATAAGVEILVDRAAVLWFDPGLAVCRALDCDPWSTLASGTLLAAFTAHGAEEAVASFQEHAYAAAVIGSVRHGTGVRDTEQAPLPYPERDEVARLLGA